jgi:hypothetical protein
MVPRLLAALLVLLPAAFAAKGTLRAGAARLEITPAADAALPMSGYAGRTDGHKGIHDPLFVRALVLDDGSAQAAIVTMDLIFAPEDLWAKMTERIQRETGIPRERILLAGTHTHGAMALTGIKEEFLPRYQPWRAALEDKICAAVQQARAALQPARMGSGMGKAYVNLNRRARMANGGWGLGNNPQGPSDRTVAVVKIETAAGEPLAVFFNFAVHGTVTGQQNLQISADLPGAASRYVEQQHGDKIVAIFTSGAAGDQNAIYGPGTDFNQVAILGRLLGEEVVRVAKEIRTSPAARIYGAQRIVTCPGQRLTPDSKTSANKIAFVDGPPVDIRVSLLMLDRFALTGVSGEVLTGIGTRLKRESPFAFTVMTTHTNGSSGYLADDAAYDQVSYEIWTTHAKRGCAETGIVNAALAMMNEY